MPSKADKMAEVLDMPEALDDVPEALFPYFGDICFSLGISPNAFRLRLILELCNSTRPIVESDIALKFCL